MGQFVIIINQIEGVELVLKALSERCTEKGCIASGDLHEGILKNLHIMEGEVLIPIPIPLVHIPAPPEPEPKATVSHLKLIK